MKQSSTRVAPTATTTTSGETFDNHLVEEARNLFKKINQSTVRFRTQDVEDGIYRQVRRLENYIGLTKSPTAKYYIYKTADLYCVVFKTPSDRVPYLHMMMDIIDKGTAELPEREKALTMFKFGDVLYDENKIEQAHNFVYKLYLEEPGLFKNVYSGFHLLIETAILLKKFDLAEKILDKEFGKVIATKQTPFCTFALLNYAKLYLHKGDYEKALGYIVETQKAHNKIFNAGQEIEIMIYENINFFLMGDLDFAKQLANSNTKLCIAQGVTKRNPQVKQTLDIINTSLNARLNNTSIPNDIITTLNHFQKGTSAILGKLLLRMAVGQNDTL